MQPFVGNRGIISGHVPNNAIVFKLECPCNGMDCNDMF